ncbi:hypothetical protein K438DRAFT_1753453 [Mycena galopus ATCC 62051]|nr:hypothetical protein K438DRAFT_1753453 [Mycena galopus ATCC 62051]
MLASRDYGDMFNIHSPPTVLAKTESKARDSPSPTGKILPSPPSTKRASAVPSSSTLKMTTLSAGKGSLLADTTQLLILHGSLLPRKKSPTDNADRLPKNTSSSDADKPAKAPKKVKQPVPRFHRKHTDLNFFSVTSLIILELVSRSSDSG